MSVYRISNYGPTAVTVRVGDVDMVIPPFNGQEVNTSKGVSVKPSDKNDVTVHLLDQYGQPVKRLP